MTNNQNINFSKIKYQHLTPQRTLNLAEQMNNSSSEASDQLLLIRDSIHEAHSSTESKTPHMAFLSSSNSSINQNQIKVRPLLVKIKAAARSLEDLNEIISDKQICKDDNLILEEYLENMENTFKLIEQGQKQLIRGLTNVNLEHISSNLMFGDLKKQNFQSLTDENKQTVLR